MSALIRVDPDHSRMQFARDFVSTREISRPEASPKPIVNGIRDLKRFLICAKRVNRHEWPEDFLAGNPRFMTGFDDRRFDVAPIDKLLAYWRLPSSEDLSTLVYRHIDVGQNTISVQR